MDRTAVNSYTLIAWLAFGEICMRMGRWVGGGQRSMACTCRSPCLQRIDVQAGRLGRVACLPKQSKANEMKTTAACRHEQNGKSPVVARQWQTKRAAWVVRGRGGPETRPSRSARDKAAAVRCLPILAVLMPVRGPNCDVF